MKCINCNEKKVDNYNYCRKCIQQLARICTCNKKFITEKPTLLIIGSDKYDITADNPIPAMCFTKLNGNVYHILGCRGCESKSAGVEISVKDSFEKALQASILSCVYQYYDSKYEYMSDSLVQEFEEYIIKNGISIGEPTGIEYSG